VQQNIKKKGSQIFHQVRLKFHTGRMNIVNRKSSPKHPKHVRGFNQQHVNSQHKAIGQTKLYIGMQKQRDSTIG